MASDIGPSDSDLNIDTRLQEFRPDSADQSSTTSSTISSCDISSEKSTSELNKKDLLERVFYRTSQDDSKTVLKFVSNIFYQQFFSKIKADFSDCIALDASSFITKCVTHVHGLKCELQLDSHFNTVTVTGIGHRVWRWSYFPKVAKSLFKRFVQEIDEYDGESSKDSGDETVSRQVDGVNQSMQAVDLEVSDSISDFPPLHVSTPNAPRPENLQPPTQIPRDESLTEMVMNSRGSQLSFLINKICCMETVIEDLKRAVILLVEGISQPHSYAHVVNRSTSDSDLRPQESDVIAEPSTQRSAPDVVLPSHASASDPTPSYTTTSSGTPQNIPVHITNGNKPSVTRQRPSLQRPVQQNEKVLLLGDSILKGINTKGLIKGVHKDSKGGATIQELIDEIKVYDMKAFSTVILHIGGNDTANGTGTRAIEDKYDELIRLIKCNNSACRVILCTVVPRGDVDVRPINDCIQRLGKHWKNQQVEVASECHTFFFADGQLSARFFNQDGIHLTNPGVKRLLDAINRHFTIVADFDTCVFGTMRPSNFQRRPGGMRQGQAGQHRMRNGGFGGFGRFRCYGCNGTGHKVADCWYRNK